MTYGLPPAVYAGGSTTSGSASDRGLPEGRARSNADRFSWLINGAYVLLDYISTIDRDLSFSFGGFSMRQELVDAICVGTELIASFNVLREQIKKIGFDFEVKLDTKDDYILVLMKKKR